MRNKQLQDVMFFDKKARRMKCAPTNKMGNFSECNTDNNLKYIINANNSFS